MNKYDFYAPTEVHFGVGQLDNLHKLSLPGKKALLVISNGKSAKTSGALERTRRQLEMANVKYVLFSEIEANPLKATVEKGGKFARDNGCDFIVALGGGSVMDACKAIATMAVNDGDLWDYVVAVRVKESPFPLLLSR